MAQWQLNLPLNKSLEYILGSGSSQFPVYIMYPGDRNKLPEEREIDEGTLILYVDRIKLIKKPGRSVNQHNGRGNNNREIFDLKYTVDWPQLQVSQVDSQMIHIDYYDKDEGYVKDKGFSNSIDIRALTWKSRDLIVLSIRCFSALNSYKNSKVISMITTEEEEKVDSNKLELNSMSDLLIELDSVKRELYEQIDANSLIRADRMKLKRQIQDMESEMQATLMGYQEVIENQQFESNDNSFQVKKQLVEQQNLNETLQSKLSQLNEDLLVMHDEK